MDGKGAAPTGRNREIRPPGMGRFAGGWRGVGGVAGSTGKGGFGSGEEEGSVEWEGFGRWFH